MRRITINFTDGTRQVFSHVGRPGGSYTITIEYKGEFAIVKDEWGNTTAFPSHRIQSVETDSGGYY